MGDDAKRPSEVFKRQMREVRERRRMTQVQLAERLEELGEEIAPTTITRMERGSRGVSLNEAFAIAAALNVSPGNLAIPMSRKVAAEVAITEGSEEVEALTASPRQARRWLRGQGPLPGADERAFYAEVSEEEWAAMQDVSLQVLLDRVQELVDAAIDEDREGMADAIDAVQDELHRMGAAERRREERTIPPSEEVRRREESRSQRRARRTAELEQQIGQDTESTGKGRQR